MHGHTRNICYRLVGYLDDWKFKKKPGNGEVRGMNLRKGKHIANSVQIDKNVDDLGDDAFGQINEGHKFAQDSHDTQNLHRMDSIPNNWQELAMKSSYTPDRYEKILKLLNEEEKAGNVVNMAGNLTTLNALLAYTGEKRYVEVLSTDSRQCTEVMSVSNSQFKSRYKDNSNWIVNSCATCHMTSKLDKLDKINMDDENVGKKVYLPNGQTH